MPDRCERILIRLLPSRVAGEAFQPALRDARIEYLDRLQGVRSRLAGLLLATIFASNAILHALWGQCIRSRHPRGCRRGSDRDGPCGLLHSGSPRRFDRRGANAVGPMMRFIY